MASASASTFDSLIERMADDDRVIIATHEPDWVIDTHDQRTSGENTSYLIKILKGKVALRMRIAGDIHNYTRHMPSPLVPGVRATPRPRPARADENRSILL